MKLTSIFLIIFLIIIGFIIIFLVKKLTEVKIFENIKIPRYSREQYLNLNAYVFSLTNESNDYVYRLEIDNEFDEPIIFSLNSKLIVGDRIVIDEKNINDKINSKKVNTYDIAFQNIFDASKISGLNFCEREGQDLECNKTNSCKDGVCMDNCKCYYLSKEPLYDKDRRSRNLYCAYGAKIVNEITYSSKVKGMIKIENGEKNTRKKVSLATSPFDIYVYISPIPYNNLLPLELSFEFEGENVKIKNVLVTLLESSITTSTFFGERTERVESQNCSFELNKELKGKLYSKTFNKYCVFLPPKIEIIEKNKAEVINTSEKSKEIVENVCKDKNQSECSKELEKRAYNLCNVFSELEICKSSENKLNTFNFFIEVEFERTEKYKKDIDVKIC